MGTNTKTKRKLNKLAGDLKKLDDNIHHRFHKLETNGLAHVRQDIKHNKDAIAFLKEDMNIKFDKVLARLPKKPVNK